MKQKGREKWKMSEAAFAIASSPTRSTQDFPPDATIVNCCPKKASMPLPHQSSFPIADAHLHLPAASPEALGAWRKAGLRRGLAAAATTEEWPGLLELAAASGGMLRVALGIHPWHLPQDLDTAMESLEAIIEQDGGHHIAAIGEIGLDRRHAGVPAEDIQYEWLRRQCGIAVRRSLPVVLHICGAWDGLLRLFREFPGLRGILHGFSGNAVQAGELLRKSHLSLSFGARLLRPGAALLQAAAAVPLPRLLVESDAPNGGATPLLCGDLVALLAHIRGERPDDISSAICGNWEQLFSGRQSFAPRSPRSLPS